jgi:hypothetical protein
MTPPSSHRGGWIWMPLLFLSVVALCAALSYAVFDPRALVSPPMFNDQSRIWQIRVLPPCDDPIAPTNTPCRGESFNRDDPVDDLDP